MTPNRIAEGQGNVLDPIIIDSLRNTQKSKSLKSIPIKGIYPKGISRMAEQRAGLGFFPC